MATLRFEPEPCPFIGQPCEYVPMAHRMVRLEKEIDRLREALRKIENYAYHLHVASSKKEYVIIQEMVVSALKETE